MMRHFKELRFQLCRIWSQRILGDVSIIVGGPEMGAWDMIFTPRGPRPRKVPARVRLECSQRGASAMSWGR